MSLPAHIHADGGTVGSVRAIEEEIAEELQFHVDQVAAELVRDGWSVDAALVEARRRFGDPRTIAKDCKKQRLRHHIMLQKLNTGLMALLVLVVAALVFRSDSKAAEQRARLDQLNVAVAELVKKNGELLGRVESTSPKGSPLPQGQATSASAALPTRLPTGETPSTEVEEAYAAWAAGKPNGSRDLAAHGDLAVPLLVPVLTGDVVLPGKIRFTAANLLGETGSALAVDPLLAALQDDWFNVRRCAALALGKLGDKRAVAALEELAANDPYVYRGKGAPEPQALVRIDAEKALAMLR